MPLIAKFLNKGNVMKKSLLKLILVSLCTNSLFAVDIKELIDSCYRENYENIPKEIVGVHCSMAALKYLGYEKGIEKDTDKAGTLFLRGCDLGDKRSCESLLRFAPDSAEAKSYLKTGSTNPITSTVAEKIPAIVVKSSTPIQQPTQPVSHGQTVTYNNGSKVTVEGMTDASLEDPQYFKQQCMNGDKGMCGEFAMDYLYGGVKDRINKRDALVVFTKGCRLGDQASCGIAKDLTKEVGPLTQEEDPATSITFQQNECNKGKSEGCYTAGMLYQTGNKVPKDISMANPLLKKACDLKNGKACFMLMLNTHDLKDTNNFYKLIPDLEKSCNYGFGKACGIEAQLYQAGGPNIRKDLTKAYKRADRGCGLGDQDSCAIGTNLMFILGATGKLGSVLK